jgi:hypothetical protein
MLGVIPGSSNWLILLLYFAALEAAEYVRVNGCDETQLYVQQPAVRPSCGLDLSIVVLYFYSTTSMTDIG